MKDKQIRMVKVGRDWRPLGVAAEVWSGGFDDGDAVWMEPKKPRNLQHHNKLFVMLDFVRHHSPVASRYLNSDDLLDEVKLLTGHYETKYRADGTPWPKPKSIAFDKMDQNEFQEFYNAALDVIWMTFFNGVKRETILKELEQFG